MTGCPAPSLTSPSKLFTPPALSTQTSWEHAHDTLARETGWPGFTGLITVEAALGTLAWYALSLVLFVVLPAQEVEGTELVTGGRLKYRFNGMDESSVEDIMRRTDIVLSFLHGNGHSRSVRGWQHYPRP